MDIQLGSNWSKIKNEIDEEADKLDISVSNAKDIIDHFLSLDNTYVWGRLAFMVKNGAGARNIFRVVDNVQLVDIPHQVHEYFGLIGIEFIFIPFQTLWYYQIFKNLATNPQEVQNLFESMRSYIIGMEIEG